MHYNIAHRADTDASFRGNTDSPPQSGYGSCNGKGKGVNFKHSASRPLEEDPDIVVIPSSTFLLTEKHVQNSVEAARRRSELLDLEQILGDASDDRCHNDDDNGNKEYNGNGSKSLINAEAGGASGNHDKSQLLAEASDSQATVSANLPTSESPLVRSKSTEQLENLQQDLTILKLKQELAELQKLQVSQRFPLTPGNTSDEAIDSISSKVDLPEEDSSRDSAPIKVSSGPKFRTPYRPSAMRVGSGPANAHQSSLADPQSFEARGHSLSQHTSLAAGSSCDASRNALPMHYSPKSLNNAQGLPKLSNPQTGD